MRTITENSRFRIFWEFFILILILASCILIPFQISFQHIVFRLGSIVIYLIDFFFFFDIFLNSFTSYRHEGSEVTERRRIAKHYLKTFFAVDILANFPFDLILLASFDIQMFNVSLVLVLRMLRLLRIVRLLRIFRRLEIPSWSNPGFLRIAKFLIIIILLLHLLACAWFFSAYIDNFPEESWVVSEGIREAAPDSQYIRSLYWTITTMTTVGFGDITPNRTPEYIITMFVMLLGATMYAFIIGNIASLFSNLDSAKVSFWNRIDALTLYLRYRRIPQDLNKRVRNYYEYLWAHHRGLKEGMLFDDLPGPLRLEVLLNLTKELLDKVPLFKYCSHTLRNELLTSLKPHTFAPEGYIVREGEKGNEIYFISRGKVEITSNDDKNSYGLLEDGDYFGDLSLILGEKRTASVKSLSYCEIFILTREDFNRIKKDYPEFKNVLKKMSSERTEKTAALVQDGVIL